MCGPTVNTTRQICGITTEKLAFECDKSVSAVMTHLYQQNSCMTSATILVSIPQCNIYC